MPAHIFSRLAFAAARVDARAARVLAVGASVCARRRETSHGEASRRGNGRRRCRRFKQCFTRSQKRTLANMRLAFVVFVAAIVC